jgi:hypothetical protein
MFGKGSGYDTPNESVNSWSGVAGRIGLWRLGWASGIFGREDYFAGEQYVLKLDL